MQESLAALGTVLRQSALADGSQARYSRAWSQWSSWCEFMGYSFWLSEMDCARNTECVGAFTVYLRKYGMNQQQQGNNYSTIRGKLSAVFWYHRNYLGYEPQLTASHAVLMRGIRRLSDPVAKHQPLTARILLAIHPTSDLCSPHGQLLWGGLLLGYFFLLRRSEYLHIDGKWSNFCLQLGNILFLTQDGQPCLPRKAKIVGIRLTGAKNNQYGREERRFQHRSGHPTLCPVKAARWILRAATALRTRDNEPALSLGGSLHPRSRKLSKLGQLLMARPATLP